MKKENIAIIILAILYAVGLFGSAVFKLDLLQLSPVNLIVSAAVLFYFHQPKNTLFWIWAIGVFQAGYILELLGVTTGRIFGQYFYGNNLGPKMADVPVIIGLNWVMLCYVSMHVAEIFFGKIGKQNTVNPIIKIALSALLMLCVDILIEHVAPQLDFWYWKNGSIPIQNYTAWYIFAFAFMFVYQKLELPLNNKIAPWLYALQLVFFAGMNWWY
ncbi:MAG: carotenoid biosynthesis protein [Bacteroidia bacterium]|nr:carotenoid biosynthesis protein [Bacteroidia bacterium]